MNGRLLGTGLILVAAMGCGMPASGAVEVGAKAPKIDVAKWIGGDAVDITDGKAVYVVEFWAEWCPPCRKSIPHLNELDAKHKAQGLVIVGVTKGDDPRGVDAFVKKTEAFYQKNNMTYRVAVDTLAEKPRPHGKSHTAYGVRGIPAAFVIAQDGTVAWAGHPLNPGFEAAINEQLRKKAEAEAEAASKAAEEAKR